MKKPPTRVCEIPRIRLPGPDGPRMIYIEAFPNEPKEKVKAVAEKFERGMRQMFNQLNLGTRHTESGIILPN